MSGITGVTIGSLRLKNPLIAGAAEHLIEETGVRAALAAGASVVVMKSTNEVEAAKAQLDAAEYAVFDETWRRREWNASAPPSAFIACRSGLYPGSFDSWLESVSRLDREAAKSDAYVAASLILGDLDHAIKMARQVQEAGLRLLELNIGTPYASQAAKGAVATELLPERVSSIVGAIRATVSMPLWVKITGQSERVPELARAAFAAGADSVVMAGRLLGLIPDLDTMRPVLGTTLGVGGYWNLPLTCHWLALSRAAVGRDRPLIATNGIQNGLDIARVMLAGASAAEISSPVMLRGFGLIERSLEEFKDYLNRKEIVAQDLIGRAADARKSFAEMPPLQGNWRNYVPPDAKDLREMRAIELDASGWHTVNDFINALKAAIGAPEWHGSNVAAFIDSMIAGGVNALEPPYVIKLVNSGNLKHEVVAFIRDLASAIEETRARRLARTGEDVAVSLEFKN